MITKDDINKIANVFSTLLFNAENKKIEEYAIDVLHTSENKLGVKQILIIDHAKAGEKAAVFRNQVLSLRSKEISSLKIENTIEDPRLLIELLQQASKDKTIERTLYKISKWEKYQMIAYNRIHPISTFPEGDSSNNNISLKLQERYITSEKLHLSSISDYLKQANSELGLQIRTFAIEIESLTNPQTEIPDFIDKMRNKLISFLKNEANTPKIKPIFNYTTIDEYKFNKETSSSILLEVIQESMPFFTIEHLDLCIEKYLFSLIHNIIFDKINLKEDDDMIEQKYQEFDQFSPSEIGISISLMACNDKLFKDVIEKLKEIENMKNPTSKLIQIYLSVELLLNQFAKSSNSRAGVDDITDILLYCLIQSKIPKICTELSFINMFSRKRLMQTAFGAHFMSFYAAVERLKTFKKEDLSHQKFIYIPVENPSEGSIILPGYINCVSPSSFYEKNFEDKNISVKSNENDKIYVKKIKLEDAVHYIFKKYKQNHFKIQNLENDNTILLFTDSINDLLPFRDEDGFIHAIKLSQLCFLDQLSPNVSLFEHFSLIQDKFNIKNFNTDEIIPLCIENVSKELKDFGFIKDSHENSIDHEFISGLNHFVKEFLVEKDMIGLTPLLCKAIHDMWTMWTAAFDIPTITGRKQIYWRYPVVILQYLAGIEITGYLDTETRKLFRSLWDSYELSPEEKICLQKLL
ncbi:hypothetical protein TVAG_115620 [Trichomonas vaginalis G3]|uniref:VPS9 domain-containing protein n=1 Tax=Trichomonas vaginalis (strain ATCC PRA-98 / G3) TaxID=412133 RepID=A2EH35_TRIV3|nr:Rab GDP/GTP exchange factor family [Trichomonas vaginalis G3]EAY08003.1 hypothetical protein TVAG_115620 [Trichomonas vaginalis G3]KAI5537377.1 Rab GDP/GTP exchange factor family [Trichomonas vaginalis G3]|eukprot:XP_001320226.1 hypothetical protein [Trichomonas vaginalis G3]